MSELLVLALAGTAIMATSIAVLLMRDNIRLLRKLKRNEFVQYVDTSGIAENPPSYVETWEGKTINFKLDGWTVSIAQLRPDWLFKHVRMIAGYYAVLRDEAGARYENRLDELRRTYAYGVVYLKTVRVIYELSRHFVKGRRGYKKALFSRAKTDVAFVIGICEQVLDYWMYVKKKISLLAQGTTVRQTTGASSADSSLGVDGAGRIYAKPRYAWSSNTVH